MAYGATHDFAKDISATLIRGMKAVNDEECGGAGVVRDDAKRGGTTLASFRANFLVVVNAAKIGGAFHQRNEKIGIVIGDHALKDSGDAFKAHASVYARL